MISVILQQLDLSLLMQVLKKDNKINLRSFKSSEHIEEQRDGPHHYLSLFSDPLDLAKWSQREIL